MRGKFKVSEQNVTSTMKTIEKPKWNVQNFYNCEADAEHKVSLNKGIIIEFNRTFK